MGLTTCVLAWCISCRVSDVETLSSQGDAATTPPPLPPSRLDCIGIATGCFVLGRCMQLGLGIEKDQDRAMVYFNKVISCGFAVEIGKKLTQSHSRPTYKFLMCYGHSQSPGHLESFPYEYFIASLLEKFSCVLIRIFSPDHEQAWAAYLSVYDSAVIQKLLLLQPHIESCFLKVHHAWTWYCTNSGCKCSVLTVAGQGHWQGSNCGIARSVDTGPIMTPSHL